VLSFTLANSVGFSDKKKTNWFACSLWGKHGEAVAKYVTKGKLIWVSGELSTREYQGRDGSNKVSLEVKVNGLDFAGGKGDSDSSAPAEPAPQPPPATDEAMPF
jgi:single-strand DNA-binding protein